MAQRTVHYVSGQILAARCGLDDLPRFLFGSLLPDAVNDNSERNRSHYICLNEEGRHYDFDAFRSDFFDKLNADPLYLGYYLHLVEDNLYRDYCHKDHLLYFISDEEVRALHRDYHLLNPYLTQRYSLSDGLLCPPDFEKEALSHIARFDPGGLIAALKNDLSEKPEGSFTYLSPAFIDGFISASLPSCEKELRAVLRGERFLRAADFHWKRP